ncbi:MAG: peptidoglycan editing factor PgeF [Clostridiales bacterium]|nr:peptidoglycan editing factor PgeF [Clostridiales bacterium]
MNELITIPRFERIAFIYHGFGAAGWGEKGLEKREEWQDFKRLYLRQVHSDIIHVISDVPGQTLRGDAMITGLPRLFLIIKTADCLPVLLVDEKKRVIAAVHCGWKGTLLRLLEKVVSGMKTQFGCNPVDLIAAFGPSISGRCYEVGEDVRGPFRDNCFPDKLFRPVPGQSRKYFLDLREANCLQLRRQGVGDRNIFSIDICTHCDRRFPSYRRDRAAAGRMFSFIALSR